MSEKRAKVWRKRAIHAQSYSVVLQSGRLKTTSFSIERTYKFIFISRTHIHWAGLPHCAFEIELKPEWKETKKGRRNEKKKSTKEIKTKIYFYKLCKSANRTRQKRNTNQMFREKKTNEGKKSDGKSGARIKRSHKWILFDNHFRWHKWIRHKRTTTTTNVKRKKPHTTTKSQKKEEKRRRRQYEYEKAAAPISQLFFLHTISVFVLSLKIYDMYIILSSFIVLTVVGVVALLPCL